MKYLWTEDTGAGLHFWKLVDQLFFDDKLSVESKGSNQGLLDAVLDLEMKDDDKYYISKTELQEKLIALLGGRAAEKLILDDISTGASNDLEVATQIARDMITVYGMSDTIGTISFKDSDGEMNYQMFGDEMQDAIGKEVKRLIDTAYRDAQEILRQNIDKLHAIASVLITKEKINEEEFNKFFNS